MSASPIRVGFIPLVDAAPLVIAKELGFAEEEGLSLDLIPAPSWSALRDMLAHGRITAAHMLAPVTVATALGLGGVVSRFEALSVLSVNGNVFGVSQDLAARMSDKGYVFGQTDAAAAGNALIAASGGRLRIGVPFPFSMHAELTYYWLSSLGIAAPQSVDVRTVPPPMMARAMELDEIDAFCVGEPWGSIAVERGHASILLPGAAIWSFAPEKVLATRQDLVTEDPSLCHSLIRAVWRAARWLSARDNRSITAELLSRNEYLNVPPIILERALSGRLVATRTGAGMSVETFVGFHSGAAGFPWRSQAAWIGSRMASRTGLDRKEAETAAKSVFRSDVYRAALADTGADLPGASEKVEGTIDVPTAVASQSGTLILQPDRFFDGRVFDFG